MAELMPLRKAMIVIAVSKYNGMPDLPGTLSSADRMVEWAEGGGDARSYTVLKITDADVTKADGSINTKNYVTRERLEEDVRPFIAGAIWDRVVVYFAGHGMMTSSLSDIWLLHDAKGDPSQGVNFLLFKTAMEKQGIGSQGKVVGLDKGQVSYVVDACRTVEPDMAGFAGSPILKWPNKRQPLETDLFLSAIQGDYSFQPNAVEGRPAFCLFTDVFVDALEGLEPDAIEYAHHRHAPVITSQTLTKWIRKELPARAKLFDEVLEADLQPGFVTHNDYYEVLETADTPEDIAGAEALEPPVLPTPAYRPNDTPNPWSEYQNAATPPPAFGGWSGRNGGRIVRELSEGEPESTSNPALYPVLQALDIADAAVVAEGKPSLLIPRGTDHLCQMNEQAVIYATGNFTQNAQPAFVQSAARDSWTMAPKIISWTRTSTVVLRDYPKDAFLINRWDSPQKQDLSLTQFASAQPARMRDAMLLADTVRRGKSFYPNRANRAGYLYYMASDYDNALRTAHYMADMNLLCFDLALTCGADLHWSRNSEGTWQVFANLPAVSEGPNSDRPHYARRAFEALANVQLTSIFPLYRQGWELLEMFDFPTMPQVMVQLAKMSTGRPGTVFPNAAIPLLTENFDYQTIDFGE